jgi:ketosteroid isomerase-like protein
MQGGMTCVTPFPIACLVLLGCQGPPNPGSGLAEADVTAIRKTQDDFAAAVTTDEYTKLGRFFTEDAVWMPRSGAPVEGRAAIESWFTVRALDLNNRILEVDGRSDLAYSRSAFTLKLDVPKFTPVEGNTLVTWRRQADGSWLIARYAETAARAAN